MELNTSVFDKFSIGTAAVLNDLTIYPILSDAMAGVPVADLEQAIENGWLEVTETSEMGTVPDLLVTNRSDKTVVIFDGEELVGAKQNRIVNVTVVVGPYTKLVIPVSCVEQGRWNWRSRNFEAGDFLYPSLRSQKFEQVSHSLRAESSHRADQGEIWANIADKSARMGVRSETGAMRDLAEHYFVDDSTLKKSFPHADNQVGFFALIRGGFSSADIFPSAEISKRKFYKMIRGHYLESLDVEMNFPELGSEDFFKILRGSLLSQVQSVGQGREFRFEGGRVQGSITTLGDHVVHLAAYSKGLRSRASRRRPSPVVY